MKLLCDGCKTVWKIGLIGKAVINGLLSNWENISNKIPQWSVLGPVLLNIFSFDDGIGRKLFKIAYDTELRGAANTLESRIWIQNETKKLKKGSEINSMKFNKDKCKVSLLRKKKKSNSQILNGKQQVWEQCSEKRLSTEYKQNGIQKCEDVWRVNLMMVWINSNIVKNWEVTIQFCPG